MADDSSGQAVVTDRTGTEPGSGEDTPGAPARRPVWKRPVAVIAGLLAVALVAVSAALLLDVLGDSSADARRTEAIDTARDYAVALSSFDFENLDANRDAIVSGSTPEFAAKYSEMVDALRQIVTDGKGKATATAGHIGIESLDEDRAVVLVFVDQQATNVVSPEGNTQKYRMVVTLIRDGDRWVVDNVDTN
ncbi:mce associated protein mas1a [Rhodococcus sp. NPDC003348]